MKPTLTEQEIAAFRELNLEEMKRWADWNRRLKWLVFWSIIIPAGIIFYCIKFV